MSFGLHSLIGKRQEFQEEMSVLLGMLRGLGMTEGKQLIWREVSFVFFSSLPPSLPPSFPPSLLEHK